MKKDEYISINRGIIIIYIILTFITLINYGVLYYITIKEYDKEIERKMELSLYKHQKQNQYKIIEIKKYKNIKIDKLIRTKQNVSIIKKKNNKYYLINIKRKIYEEKLLKREKELIREFFKYFIANLTFSIILAGFILSPIRNKIRLTEEFIKDILHDIDNPLSIIKINTNLIKYKINKNEIKIEEELKRIEMAVEKIIFLENNLKAYQLEKQLINKEIEIIKIIKEKEYIYKNIYKNIKLKIKEEKPNIKIKTSEDIFIRIIDNILSNAYKYNKENGIIEVIINQKNLIIKDNGVGIKNPNKVFNRLYKENERGVGIGLNIVKKLINEIGMTIEIKSKEKEGTIVRINF